MSPTPEPQQPARLTKAQAITHWDNLPALNPADLINPIPYEHKGSTYAEDGIRITGSQDFCDAVMSRLKSMMACENGVTRLGLSYKQATDKETGEPFDSWAVYIQCHERGQNGRSPILPRKTTPPDAAEMQPDAQEPPASQDKIKVHFTDTLRKMFREKRQETAQD